MKKVFFNSFWMMLEKIISIFGLFFVTSLVAKYVGPNVYGNIALGLSIFQIVQAISQLGSDVIIFKRVSKNLQSGINLILTTFNIRFILYIVTSTPVLLYLYFREPSGFIYYFSIFIATLFQSIDVYSIYFDARLQSKRNTIINSYGLILSLLIRYGIVSLKFPPEYLCISIILAAFIPFIIRRMIFLRDKEVKYSKAYKSTSKLKYKYIRYLIYAGSSFVISTVSVAIYVRMSTLLVGMILGNEDVGIYAIGATLGSSWFFILSSIITSSLPSIFNEKNKDSTIKKVVILNAIVIGISLFVVLSFWLVGRFILNFLYGPEYDGAYSILIILSFTTMFSALGLISSRLISKYSGYSYLSIKSIFVTVICFLLNYYLISLIGLEGAAYAMLITELFSLTIMNYFFKKISLIKVHFLTLFPFLLT